MVGPQNLLIDLDNLLYLGMIGGNTSSYQTERRRQSIVHVDLNVRQALEKRLGCIEATGATADNGYLASHLFSLRHTRKCIQKPSSARLFSEVGNGVCLSSRTGKL